MNLKRATNSTCRLPLAAAIPIALLTPFWPDDTRGQDRFRRGDANGNGKYELADGIQWPTDWSKRGSPWPVPSRDLSRRAKLGTVVMPTRRAWTSSGSSCSRSFDKRERLRVESS